MYGKIQDNTANISLALSIQRCAE